VTSPPNIQLPVTVKLVYVPPGIEPPLQVYPPGFAANALEPTRPNARTAPNPIRTLNRMTLPLTVRRTETLLIIGISIRTYSVKPTRGSKVFETDHAHGHKARRGAHVTFPNIGPGSITPTRRVSLKAHPSVPTAALG